MLLVCQELGSGYLFFEQASEKRSTEHWYQPIKSALEKFGLKVRHLVSDRVKALIQLGNPEYLGVHSMPDLFHFNQTLARRAGAHICKAYNAALKKYQEAKATFPAWRLSKIRPFEDMYIARDLDKNDKSHYPANRPYADKE